MSDEKEPDTFVDADDLFELMRYLREHSAHIYVRTKVGDRFESLSLQELSGDTAIDTVLLFITRWFQQPGYRPVRVRTDEEMVKDPKGSD